MNREEILKSLESYNDQNFKFDPINHKYTYEDNHFISVTQFISKFHKPFDTEYWSNYKAKERGISKEEILKEWKEKNDRANFIGTSTHDWIEFYFNGEFKKLPTDKDVVDRINKFNHLYADHLHKLEPVCFERKIFSKKWKIAGMIDSIFLYKDKVIIIDYKTNKEFITDETIKYKEYLLPPFDHLYKTHLNEYSIQISMYMMILKEIGINVSAGYLLYIGPNDSKIYRSLDLVTIIEEYLTKQNI